MTDPPTSTIAPLILLAEDNAGNVETVMGYLTVRAKTTKVRRKAMTPAPANDQLAPTAAEPEIATPQSSPAPPTAICQMFSNSLKWKPCRCFQWPLNHRLPHLLDTV